MTVEQTRRVALEFQSAEIPVPSKTLVGFGPLTTDLSVAVNPPSCIVPSKRYDAEYFRELLSKKLLTHRGNTSNITYFLQTRAEVEARQGGI